MEIDPLFQFVFTIIASTEGFVMAVLIIMLLYAARDELRTALVFSLWSGALIAIVAFLKETLSIRRPEGALIESVGYGFPSGHATGATYLALVICLLASRISNKTLRYSICAACILLASTISMSRIYFSLHTPLQVLGGVVLGMVWAGGWFLYQKHK